MEEVFSHEFRSASITVFTFVGLSLVGFGLGFMFWLDFRRRFVSGRRVAGRVVLIGGTLLGAVFGYFATQPGYFKKLTADSLGITLEYYLFGSDVVLGWNDVDGVAIEQDRLLVTGKSGDGYQSVVVYRGEQALLERSITRLMPNGSP
jgi:hypothetical protein